VRAVFTQDRVCRADNCEVQEMCSRARILLVDDQPVLQGLIADYLRDHYDVSVAGSGEEALPLLDEHDFDLLIADVNMPGMRGPELVAEARRRKPGLKTALITGYPIDEFIGAALEHEIGSIISKSIPFDFEELSTIIDGLITEQFFGLERYMASGTSIQQFRVRNAGDIARIRETILDQPEVEDWPEQRKLGLKLALDESITNAAYHSNRIEKGGRFFLSEDQEIIVYCGQDLEKIGISVVDKGGRLTRDTILRKFDACVTQDEEYFYQDSGRGLFIIRNMVDRFIINIRRGVRTELIALLYLRKHEVGHRPILINEI